MSCGPQRSTRPDTCVPYRTLVRSGGRLISEPKPFASLSSGLLARKGAAKPAMRPQGFGQIGVGTEDLGWNDMGYAPAPAEPYPDFEHDIPERVPSKISALTPAPKFGQEPESAPQEQEEEMGRAAGRARGC